MSKTTTEERKMTTSQTQTGDLDIARILMAHDDFLEGREGLEPSEYFDVEPSEPGTLSIYLNGEVVDALLAARGWKRGDDGAIYAPDGDSKHWDRAEALTLALTAEVV